jgi:type I restriction enzyme, S subunit
MTTLGDVAEIISGSTPSTSVTEYWDGDIPWITPKDLSGYGQKCINRGARCISQAGYDSCSTTLVPPGTVLLTTRAPIGYVAIAADAVCTNQGFKNLIPSDRITSDYLYWYLRGSRSRLLQSASGTTFPELSARRLRQIPIPLPPLEEQQAIVRRIEERFSLLEACSTSLLSIERRIRAFRESVLEQAASGRLALGMSANRGQTLGAALQPAATGPRADPGSTSTSSDRPPVPAHWRWATVSDIAKLVTDGDHNPPQRVSTGIPHLTAKHVKLGRLTYDDCTFISSSDFDRSSRRYRPAAGDVLVTCVGTIGQTAVVPGDRVFSADRNLAAIRTRRETMDPRFLQLVLSAPWWRKHLKSASGYTAQPHLYLTDLRAIPVPVPPLEEQESLVRAVAALSSEADRIGAAVSSSISRTRTLQAGILGNAIQHSQTPGGVE